MTLDDIKKFYKDLGITEEMIEENQRKQVAEIARKAREAETIPFSYYSANTSCPEEEEVA